LTRITLFQALTLLFEPTSDSFLSQLQKVLIDDLLFVKSNSLQGKNYDFTPNPIYSITPIETLRILLNLKPILNLNYKEYSLFINDPNILIENFGDILPSIQEPISTTIETTIDSTQKEISTEENYNSQNNIENQEEPPLLNPIIENQEVTSNETIIENQEVTSNETIIEKQKEVPIINNIIMNQEDTSNQTNISSPPPQQPNVSSPSPIESPRRSRGRPRKNPNQIPNVQQPPKKHGRPSRPFNLNNVQNNDNQ